MFRNTGKDILFLLKKGKKKSVASFRYLTSTSPDKRSPAAQALCRLDFWPEDSMMQLNRTRTWERTMEGKIFC